MEEVEITMTLEIMADSSLTTGPWRVTTLVEEIQGDPMVVSFTPPSTLHIQWQHIRIVLNIFCGQQSLTAGGYGSGGGGGGGYGSRRY